MQLLGVGREMLCDLGENGNVKLTLLFCIGRRAEKCCEVVRKSQK